MTATPTTGRAVDRLVLSTPDAFLASVPHMVGFDCADSVVLVGLGPNPVDRTIGAAWSAWSSGSTPQHRTPPGDLASIARSAAEPMARSGSTEVIVAVFGATPALGAELPSAVLVDELLARIDDAGLGVRDALFTDGTSRWSYGCDNPSCCPPEGRVIPESTRTLVAAEFAGVGAAMAPSREALVEEIAPDVARIAAVDSIRRSAAARRRGAAESRGVAGLRHRSPHRPHPVDRRSGRSARWCRGASGPAGHPGSGHVLVGHGTARDGPTRHERPPRRSGPLRPSRHGRARGDGARDRTLEQR